MIRDFDKTFLLWCNSFSVMFVMIANDLPGVSMHLVDLLVLVELLPESLPKDILICLNKEGLLIVYRAAGSEEKLVGRKEFSDSTRLCKCILIQFQSRVG